MTEWQQIGEVPIDSGRLVLCDPVNFADVDRHDRELERDPELYDRSPDYELIGNELGCRSLSCSRRGSETGDTRSKLGSRRPLAPSVSPRSGCSSYDAAPLSRWCGSLRRRRQRSTGQVEVPQSRWEGLGSPAAARQAAYRNPVYQRNRTIVLARDPLCRLCLPGARAEARQSIT